MRTQLLFSFLLLALFSCKDKEEDAALKEETVKKEIIGTWKVENINTFYLDKSGNIFHTFNSYGSDYIYESYVFSDNTVRVGSSFFDSGRPYTIKTLDGKMILTFSYNRFKPVDRIHHIESLKDGKMVWKTSVANTTFTNYQTGTVVLAAMEESTITLKKQ